MIFWFASQNHWWNYEKMNIPSVGVANQYIVSAEKYGYGKLVAGTKLNRSQCSSVFFLSNIRWDYVFYFLFWCILTCFQRDHWSTPKFDGIVVRVCACFGTNNKWNVIVYVVPLMHVRNMYVIRLYAFEVCIYLCVWMVCMLKLDGQPHISKQNCA